MEKIRKGVWIKFMRIAFTGHRPNNKYMGGYDYNSDKNRIIYSYIYNSVLNTILNSSELFPWSRAGIHVASPIR